MIQEDFPLRHEPTEPNERRVEAIVTRARRETSTRDLLDFGGARIWMAAAGILGLALALLSGARSRRPDATNSDPKKPGQRDDSPTMRRRPGETRS